MADCRRMKKQLYLLGAGDLASEIYSWIQVSEEWSDKYEVVACYDDNENARDTFPYAVAKRDAISEIPLDGTSLVLAISDPKTKLFMYDKLKKMGFSFETLVHPTVLKGLNVSIGEGTIISAGSFISNEASIGYAVTINLCTTIGHHSIIGDGSTLNSHCDVTGHVQLGKGVYFGSRAGVLPKIKIGDFAIIGSGSTVMKSVKPNKTVVGNPAKVLF
jgi:sugar O-acyltransferase (sialic acid O-acetyltransferase NeuD family)